MARKLLTPPTMLFRNDPSHYTIVSTRTVPGTLSLIRSLVSAANGELVPIVLERLEVMHDKGGALQQTWIATSETDDSGAVRRGADNSLDRSWRVVHDRLHHWVVTEHEDHRDEAAKVHARLFPTGLDFTRFRYPKQWAESERRLKMIESEKLEETLEDLCDPRFLTALRNDHAAYGCTSAAEFASDP